MEKALANLALRTAGADAGEPTLPKTPTPASTSSALKGVSQELLDRVSHPVLAQPRGWGRSLCPRHPWGGSPSAGVAQVRAKEARRLQALLTRDARQEERAARLARLPAMARVLRGLFVAEKKPALSMELLCARLADSCPELVAPGRNFRGESLREEDVGMEVRSCPVGIPGGNCGDGGEI